MKYLLKKDFIPRLICMFSIIFLSFQIAYKLFNTLSYVEKETIISKVNTYYYWDMILPSEENIEKLEGYKSILPNIDKIYENENTNSKEEKEITYSSKLLELFLKIKSALE